MGFVLFNLSSFFIRLWFYNIIFYLFLLLHFLFITHVIPTIKWLYSISLVMTLYLVNKAFKFLHAAFGQFIFTLFHCGQIFDIYCSKLITSASCLAQLLRVSYSQWSCIHCWNWPWWWASHGKHLLSLLLQLLWQCLFCVHSLRFFSFCGVGGGERAYLKFMC